jgi:Tol biopolymer transport system component
MTVALTTARIKRRALMAAGAILAFAILAAALALLYQQLRPAPAAVQRPLTQLTFESGLAGSPTWSPDGRFIAYNSDHNGNFDIWVRPVGEGNAVQVTHDPAHDWRPDWSPDGKLIVFRSEREGGGLYLVPVLGGRERRISSFGYLPRWSPDGSRILFFSGPFLGMSEPRKLYVVALDGSAPREVLSDFRIVYGVWHPDGRRVTFSGRPPGLEDGLWTVPLRGGTPVKSESTPRVQEQWEAASFSGNAYIWAPSGRALFLEASSRGVRNLWRFTVDPGTLRLIAGPDRLTTASEEHGDIAVSPDGKKLAFMSYNQAIRIWSWPFDAATGQIRGEGQPVTPGGMEAARPDLTPDGKNLVFMGSRAGRTAIWKRSLESGREALLFEDDLERSSPHWSRDGARMVYTRNYGGTSNYAIFLWEAHNETETALTSPVRSGDENWVPVDWSPDGKWVLVSSDHDTPGRQGIWVYPVSAAPRAETQARRVTSNPEYNLWQARFSPDGRWIAFVAVNATDARASTIYVVPSSGGDWTRITEGRFWDDKPRWSPDGKSLYVVSSRTGFLNVWGIRFNPVEGKAVGKPFQVTAFERPDHMVLPSVVPLELSIARDRLAIPILQISGNVWMLENVDQ